jgi:hypothetical protein
MIALGRNLEPLKLIKKSLEKMVGKQFESVQKIQIYKICILTI